MRTKLSKRICSVILAVIMLVSLVPVTALAITDEDIPASVELGKGFNLLDCEVFESANLKSAILFDNVAALNSSRTRIGAVESYMTYITSMSSYLDNTHTDISTEVGVTKEGLLAKAEIKAKFGFKGEWESSGTVNTSRLILEIIAKAYQYSLNIETSDPWEKNADGTYVSINPIFAYDLIHMNPKDLFDIYGTHIVTQYDAGGEAYTAYEGTDASNSMKSQFDITTNADVKVDATDIAEVNVSVSASGGESHENSFANNSKQTSMRVRGGDPFYSTFEKIISGDADASVNAWLQSMSGKDGSTDSTKAAMIQTEDLKLMPLWELLEMDYGTDHSARVAQLRDYFQENANREYLELYEEFIYGIPGDYADNYDVVQTAFVTDETLDAVETAPAGLIPIYTEKDLNKIGKSAAYPLDGNYILMRDIEMKYAFPGIGSVSGAVQPFTGDFDGNGHAIYYLEPVPAYNGNSEVYMGFILYNKGNLHNIRFLDSNFDCRESEKTTATINASVANTATAYLGLAVGRNVAETNSSNLDNVYITNATMIVEGAPTKTYAGLAAGCIAENTFITDITVVDSYIDVSAATDSGLYYIGAVSGASSSGSGMISHDNVVKCDKNAYVGGCLGAFINEENLRAESYAYDNEVTSASMSGHQLSGYGDLNAYTVGGSDVHALSSEKLFKYYCDKDHIVGGNGGYAEEWAIHSETASKPWLIVHAPDGITAYQNSLIGMKNIKVYFAKYGDDTAVYEDVTDRVNFIYNFSEVKNDVPVTVVYGKHLVEFMVDVVEPVVKDIAIVNSGKTQFRVGETFDNSVFSGQVLYSNNLTDSLSAVDDDIKFYIPALAGSTPVRAGEFEFSETTSGVAVVVEYKGCTETYQISVLPEDLTEKLHLSPSGAESAPGGEFAITIELNNNPGIVALSTHIEYNNDIFEAVEVTDAGLLDCFQKFEVYAPNVPLLWMNTDMNAVENTKTGLLATVRFKVKEDACDAADFGMHLFKLADSEALNKAGKTIEIPDTTFKVKLNELTVGDVNCDSEVGIWDAVLLTQHTFDIPNSLNLAAADVNRDGIVDDLDATNLNRYMVDFFGTDLPGIFDVRVKSNAFADEIMTGLVVNNVIPQPEERLGHIFIGYYLDEACTVATEILPAQSVREMVIYAKYENGYKIESDEELVNDIHVYGTETPLALKSSTGGGAITWNVYDGTKLVCANVTAIPASCKPASGLRVVKQVESLEGKVYSITYVNNVESVFPAENPTTYTYGVNTALVSPTSAINDSGREVLYFRGWYDNAEFNGMSITNTLGKSGDLTLYAKWEYRTYKVSLDARGGSLENNVLVHTYGTETVLPIPTHTNPAYKFVRWVHDNQTATSIPADFYNRSATYAYEAYAEWSYEPTVTLTLRGSATDPFSTAVEVRDGVNAFAKYSIAVPAGDYETEDHRVHSFLGWYKTGTDLLVTKQYLENVEVDLDLTARWKDTTEILVVNFYDHDNTLLHSDQYIYRKSIQFVEVPEYTGTCESDQLVFTGWKLKTGRYLGDTDYVDVSSIHTSGAREVDVVAYLRDRAKSVLLTYRHDESYYDFGRTEFAQIYNYIADRATYPYISSGIQNTIPAERKSFEKQLWFSLYDSPFMLSQINVNTVMYGTGTMEVDGISYCMYYSNGDTLYTRDYVEWASNTYNILCDVNPGPGSLLDIMTYTYGGETVTLPTNVTKEDYVFEGWYDNREYEGNPITQVTGDNKGDKIFYAKWTKSN